MITFQLNLTDWVGENGDGDEKATSWGEMPGDDGAHVCLGASCTVGAAERDGSGTDLGAVYEMR